MSSVLQTSFLNKTEAARRAWSLQIWVASKITPKRAGGPLVAVCGIAEINLDQLSKTTAAAL